MLVYVKMLTKLSRNQLVTPTTRVLWLCVKWSPVPKQIPLSHQHIWDYCGRLFDSSRFWLMLPNLAAVIFCDGEASFSLFLCASLVTKKLITTDTTKEKRRGEKKRDRERNFCYRVRAGGFFCWSSADAMWSGKQWRARVNQVSRYEVRQTSGST